jgi:hypothetical protein
MFEPDPLKGRTGSRSGKNRRKEEKKEEANTSGKC